MTAIELMVLPACAGEAQTIEAGHWLDGPYGMGEADIAALVEDDTPTLDVFAVNWNLPVTPPGIMAPDWPVDTSIEMFNAGYERTATLIFLGRQLKGFGGREASAAVLFDHWQTLSQEEELWSARPVFGTALGKRDALSVEALLGLNRDAWRQLGTYWKHGWSRGLNTELGAGYKFGRAQGAVFRARAAIRLTRSVDCWIGGDVGRGFQYAAGMGVTWHWGGPVPSGRNGAPLYASFPSGDYPSLLYPRVVPVPKIGKR